MRTRPELSPWQIWNMSFGFFGIQFGWGLQMANMSAIYQFLGASPEHIAGLWIAAPLTGLIVQPIVGYYSDRTWTRLGRRRPFFLLGAVLASLALIAMPNSSTVWMAAGLLWILDASINISMEPFRAFVGDLLPDRQRKVGFAMQSLLIGAGAVLSSLLPWFLTNVVGMTPAEGVVSRVPETVKLAFYCGAGVFLLAVLYTVFTTREYPPEDMAAFEAEKARSKGVFHGFTEIFEGIVTMPRTMRQLAVPQFFTWLTLFCMWIYFTPSVSARFFDADPSTPAYLRGVEWAGVCFSVYNGVAFVFSFFLLLLVRYFSAKRIHFACLIIGGLGLLSVVVMPNHYGLIGSMTAVGVAWASILSMPYAMLSNAIPGEKMGFYMGVFNFFIVLPQILVALGMGFVVKHLFGGDSIYAIAIGGASLGLAALTLMRVSEQDTETAPEPPVDPLQTV